MAKRYFFFPHALQPSKTPGRVPFEVSSFLLSYDGKQVEQATVFVAADGYIDRGRSAVGGNQDPLVLFVDNPFLSFCRINHNGLPCKVNELSQNPAGKVSDKPLSHIVQPGDVIVFGKWDPVVRGEIERVWVDTVLVVQDTMEWPTHEAVTARRRMKNPRQMSQQVAGGAGAKYAYTYNISDAEKDRGHQYTKLSEHRIIRGKVSKEKNALQGMNTSFITISNHHSEKHFGMPAFVDERTFKEYWSELTKSIRERIQEKAFRKGQGMIAELPANLAKALITAIINESGRFQGQPGFVALPPLKPVGSVRRARKAGGKAGKRQSRGCGQTVC